MRRLRARLLARLASDLHRLATTLGRWAADSTPRADPRTDDESPEAAWRRFADPGPPAHWVAVLRERAPRLLTGGWRTFRTPPDAVLRPLGAPSPRRSQAPGSPAEPPRSREVTAPPAPAAGPGAVESTASAPASQQPPVPDAARPASGWPYRGDDMSAVSADEQPAWPSLPSTPPAAASQASQERGAPPWQVEDGPSPEAAPPVVPGLSTEPPEPAPDREARPTSPRGEPARPPWLPAARSAPRGAEVVSDDVPAAAAPDTPASDAAAPPPGAAAGPSGAAPAPAWPAAHEPPPTQPLAFTPAAEPPEPPPLRWPAVASPADWPPLPAPPDPAPAAAYDRGRLERLEREQEGA